MEGFCMRRLALSLTAFVIFAATSTATARPAQAQGVFDQIKKKADAAKKAADEVKRKADSTANAAAKAKAATDSAKTAAESAKTSVEDAAKTMTTGGTAPSAATQQGTRPSTSASSANAKPASPPPQKNGRAPAPAATASSGPQALSRTAAHVEEQLVFAGDAGTPFAISPRGQHVAAKTLKGSRTVMVYDGVAGPPFDEIPPGIGQGNSPGAFSDDGYHHAYVGRQGTQWVVMEDEKEVGRGGPFFQNSGNATMTLLGFTPGGKHLYFAISDIDHNRFQFYFDGKPDPEIKDFVRPVISPDGEHYAYEYQVNKETGHPLPALMVDGKRAAYAGTAPQFTADGLHLYTTMGVPGASAMDVLLDGKPIMRVGGATLHMAPAGSAMLASVLTVSPTGQRTVFLTIGNKRVPNTDCHGNAGIDAVYFSADVKHWAVRCQDSNTSYWVMTDGKKGQEYQGIASQVSFTADGRPVYMATANAKQFIVVGDQEYGPYAAVVPITPATTVNSAVILPQPTVVAGNRVGFIAMESNSSGLNRLVVVDGKPIKAVGATDLAFSPDGSHFAYIEGQSPRVVVLDGVQRVPAVFAHDFSDPTAPFVFSQDGKHLAFASMPPSGGPGHAVAIDDGLFVTPAISTYDITFTPDGKHLMWLGTHSGNRMRMYVDGEPVLESDQPAGPQQSADAWWRVGPDGVLTFVAQDGGVLKRFRVTPGSSSIEARSRR
jgi:hypothetical protein